VTASSTSDTALGRAGGRTVGVLTGFACEANNGIDLNVASDVENEGFAAFDIDDESCWKLDVLGESKGPCCGVPACDGFAVNAPIVRIDATADGEYLHAAIIDTAVAIVINVVGARFGLWKDLACASGTPAPIGAGLYTVFAGSDSFCAGISGVTGSRECLIDGPVTVVVFAIADFGGWLGVSCAGSPLTSVAGLRAIFAKAFAACSGWSCITGLGE
jgi:hypothetical protein